MHIEPTQPLSIAAGVLMPATLASVRKSPSYHLQGWRILDRWAFESPAQFRAFETEGEVILLGRLLEQRRRGLAEQEILALYEICTTLT